MKQELNRILKIIAELESIRKIPQFIFISGIHPISTLKVRQEILSFKEANPEVKEIDFIIESGGGSAGDAYRIIRTLRKNFETVNIIVPFWAKSAATLLSLGGSSIIMDEFGEFGPLDTQLKDEKNEMPDPETTSALLDEYSLDRIEKRAQGLYRNMFINQMKTRDVKIQKSKLSEQFLNFATEFYKPLLEDINPYEIGSKARYLAIGEKYAERILVQFNNISNDDRDLFIDYIVHDCPDHGFIIDYDIISTFLSNVKLSKDISIEYSKILTKLSNVFIESKIELTYVGFFDKKMIIESDKNVSNNGSSVNDKLKGKKEKGKK